MPRLFDSFWGWPDGWVWRLTRQLTERSRRRRFNLFMRVMKPGPNDRVLDVGVGEGSGRAVNFFEEWYPWKHQVTAVALSDLPEFRRAFPSVNFAIGDGRRLPFSDGSFDLYFSNAVIEHVGTADDQKKFLAEACRVAKRAFLSTPNRWFPVDPHTLIPFAHWLPLRVRNAIYRALGRGYWASEGRLRLVGARELRRLVPPGVRATFHRQRLLGLTTNLNIILEAEKRIE